jgi:1-acyl-sn-glycerol-3-phosphate acyltransferase
MLYSLKLALIILTTLPAAFFTVLFGFLDCHGKRVYGISRCWTWTILKISGIILNVQGRNLIDPRRPYIFMSNHQSNIDIPVLVQSLTGFQLRWIAKKELLWVPLFGWALWAAKHITVDRTKGAGTLSSLNRAKERIENGISVVVFPEGTRSEDGALLPFKRGGFLLAVKTRTPIVPVTINGSGAVLRKGDWRVKGGYVQVTIGQPVSVENYRGGNLRSLAAHVHELMEAQISQHRRETSAETRYPMVGNVSPQRNKS